MSAARWRRRRAVSSMPQAGSMSMARRPASPSAPPRRPGARPDMGTLAASTAERVALAVGAILVRPLRPDDRAAYCRFLGRLAPEDVRLRMGRPIRADRRLCDRFLEFDRSREEAFVALDSGAAILGVGRIVLEAGPGDDGG